MLPFPSCTKISTRCATNTAYERDVSFEKCQNSPCIPPARYFTALLLTQQDTVTITARHFCSFVDRIKHGFVKSANSVKSVGSSAKNMNKLLLRFDDTKTSRQVQACWVFVTCHWTFYRVRLAMLLAHSLFLFASTRIPMRTERNPLSTLYSPSSSIFLSNCPFHWPTAFVSLTAVHEGRREQTNAMLFR